MREICASPVREVSVSVSTAVGGVDTAYCSDHTQAQIPTRDTHIPETLQRTGFGKSQPAEHPPQSLTN